MWAEYNIDFGPLATGKRLTLNSCDRPVFKAKIALCAVTTYAMFEGAWAEAAKVASKIQSSASFSEPTCRVGLLYCPVGPVDEKLNLAKATLRPPHISIKKDGLLL